MEEILEKIIFHLTRKIELTDEEQVLVDEIIDKKLEKDISQSNLISSSP